MTQRRLFAIVVALLASAAAHGPALAQKAHDGAAADFAAMKPGRDPGQAIDEEYTRRILEDTTEKFFLSPLVDYLPASKTVPTPKAVLGDIAGAKGNLPYSKQVYEYMRLLAKSAPARVKVFSIGTTEEGREMIAVAVASEEIIARIDENKARLAKLADPRTIEHGRRAGGADRAGDDSRVLHHRHDPLAGGGRANRADGDGLPAASWTTAHTSGTSATTSSRSSRRSSKWTAAIGWSISTTGRRRTRSGKSRRSCIGANTSPTTTIATPSA